MTTRLRFTLVMTTLTTCLILPAPSAAGQDALTRAKDFYASAAYEEALQVLGTLHSKTPAREATEVATYQVFCLVALGRSEEARHTVESIVRIDPLYHPPAAETSPRVRTFFEDVRRPMLPAVVKQSYAKAKDAYDRKDMIAATAEFERVMTLVDEMGGSDNQSVADLRTLAAGFRELSKAATPPAPPPAPEPPASSARPSGAPAAGGDGSAPVAAAPPASVGAPVYGPGDAEVRAPVPVSNPLPMWTPGTPGEERRTFRGALDLLVDQDGRVLSVSLAQSVQARYDPMLLKAAQAWTFLPALKNGQAVRYHYILAVQLGK
jgi:hypothetical protein